MTQSQLMIEYHLTIIIKMLVILIWKKNKPIWICIIKFSMFCHIKTLKIRLKLFSFSTQQAQNCLCDFPVKWNIFHFIIEMNSLILLIYRRRCSECCCVCVQRKVAAVEQWLVDYMIDSRQWKIDNLNRGFIDSDLAAF